MKLINYVWPVIIIFIFVSLRLSLIYALPEIRHDSQLFLMFGIGNIILLWFLGKKLFSRDISLYLVFLYSVSPWTAYMEISGTIYIFILFCILGLFLGGLFLKSKLGKILLFCLAAGIVLLFTYNKISLFSDPGLINSVNQFRGETSQSKIAYIGKITENRYTYLSEHVLFNILNQFTPSVYFTPQFKLLNFSFSPPIFLGFIVPFLFGLPVFFKMILDRKLVALSVFYLTIPSILSKQSPDLTKLIIVAPVLFLIISLGIKTLVLKRQKKVFNYLLLICISLVTVQFFVTIQDILLREPARLQMLTGAK